MVLFLYYNVVQLEYFPRKPKLEIQSCIQGEYPNGFLIFRLMAILKLVTFLGKILGIFDFCFRKCAEIK